MGDVANVSELSAVHDFIAILEAHCRECERQGKYVEAQIAKTKVKQLQERATQRKSETLRSHQLKAQLRVEDEHTITCQAFNEEQDETLQTREAEWHEAIGDMKERHRYELDSLRASMEAKLAKSRPKFSTSVLQLRSTEQNLVKREDYFEAHRVKQMADQAEEKELERMRHDMTVSLNRELDTRRRKQAVEIAALEKRLSQWRIEFNKERETAQARMLRRYHNQKHTLRHQAAKQNHPHHQRQLKSTLRPKPKAEDRFDFVDEYQEQNDSFMSNNQPSRFDEAHPELDHQDEDEDETQAEYELRTKVHVAQSAKILRSRPVSNSSPIASQSFAYV